MQSFFNEISINLQTLLAITGYDYAHFAAHQLEIHKQTNTTPRNRSSRSMASDAPGQVLSSSDNPVAVEDIKNEPEVPDVSLLDFCAQLDDYTPTVSIVSNYAGTLLPT